MIDDELKRQLEIAREEALGAQEEAEEIEEVEEVEEAEEAEEIEGGEQAEEVEEGNLPGYKTYEQWIEEGRDPADFKGENAYKAEYGRIQEVKDLTTMVENLVNTIDEEKKTAAQKAREDERNRIEAELREAKEDLDVDKALELSRKLGEFQDGDNVVEKPEPEPIQRFRQENPIINPQSPSYDADFELAMASAVNTRLQSFGGVVNDDLVARVANSVFTEMKGLYPEKFESPKNQRKTVSKPTPTKTKAKFQHIQGEGFGGVKLDSLTMLKDFERKFGKEHPVTLKFKKSLEA